MKHSMEYDALNARHDLSSVYQFFFLFFHIFYYFRKTVRNLFLKFLHLQVSLNL